MNHRNNRRSEATKNKIKQTLIEMLHTQNINKVTVQALCEKAAGADHHRLCHSCADVCGDDRVDGDHGGVGTGQ